MSPPRSTERTLRGKVAVVGLGETRYYKHGQAPDAEVKLALQAILAACEDAGLSPLEIDGFASYSNDRNEPSRLAAALGLPELRFSNMQWGGGGGGGSAAVGNAAAAILSGMSDCVVVFRALAQGQFQRFGTASGAKTVSGEQALTFPYGLFSPAQRFAMRVMRFLHEHGLDPSVQRAIALASYHHAQQNPRAVMHGRPLSPEAYDASRWIVEPFRLCFLWNTTRLTLSDLTEVWQLNGASTGPGQPCAANLRPGYRAQVRTVASGGPDFHAVVVHLDSDGVTGISGTAGRLCPGSDK